MTLHPDDEVTPFFALAWLLYGGNPPASVAAAEGTDADMIRLALATAIPTVRDRIGVKDSMGAPIERAQERLIEALHSGRVRAVRIFSGSLERVDIPQKAWITRESAKARNLSPSVASDLSGDMARLGGEEGGYVPVRLSRQDVAKLEPMKLGRFLREVQRGQQKDVKAARNAALAEWRFGQIEAAAAAIMRKPRAPGYSRWQMAADVARQIGATAREAGHAADALQQQETHLVLKNAHTVIAKHIPAQQREDLAARVERFFC